MLKTGKNAIVVVLDRMSAGYLGPYGNTWLATPAWNRLASQSLLFEHAWVDSTDLGSLYQSYWRARHALVSDVHAPGGTLFDWLRDGAGVRSTLITDEWEVAHHPLASSADEPLYIAPDPVERSAELIEHTQLARLVFYAADWMSQPDRKNSSPFVLWLHARCMAGPWDAPWSLRGELAAEEDPTPSDAIEVPECRLPADVDPDIRLGFSQSYGGQVMAADACLEFLMSALELAPCGPDTLLLVTSSRGFPLGEHGVVGGGDPRLYSELLQVPCLVQYPDGASAAIRTQSLWQPELLPAMLMDWFELPPPASARCAERIGGLRDDQQITLLDRAVSVSTTQIAMRTPGWFFTCPRASIDQDAAECELYAKPDDRWEVNQVASRCPEVVAGLRAAWSQFASSAAEAFSHSHPMPPLPPQLMDPN